MKLLSPDADILHSCITRGLPSKQTSLNLLMASSASALRSYTTSAVPFDRPLSENAKTCHSVPCLWLVDNVPNKVTREMISIVTCLGQHTAAQALFCCWVPRCLHVLNTEKLPNALNKGQLPQWHLHRHWLSRYMGMQNIMFHSVHEAWQLKDKHSLSSTHLRS